MKKCLPILLSCFLLLALSLPLFFQPCNVAQAETYTITAGDYVAVSGATLSGYTATYSLSFCKTSSPSTVYDQITYRSSSAGGLKHYFARRANITGSYSQMTANNIGTHPIENIISSWSNITVLADTVVSESFYNWFFTFYESAYVPTVDIWYVFRTDYVGIYPHAYIYQGELGSTYQVTQPQFTTPVPTGYTFLGWFDTAGNQFDFDLTYTATETEPVQYDLYGKWQTPYDTLFEILILPYTAFFDGFGNGVDWLFNELFIDSNGNMSTYGQFIFYIAGATLVVYIIKTVLYILIRGGRKCKND